MCLFPFLRNAADESKIKLRVKEKLKAVNNMCIFFSKRILPVAVTARDMMQSQLEKEKDLIFMSGRRGSHYHLCNDGISNTNKQHGEQRDSGSLLSGHLPRTGSLLSDTCTALSPWTFPPLGANLDLSYSH